MQAKPFFRSKTILSNLKTVNTVQPIYTFLKIALEKQQHLG
jgi:hypothetical protein